MTLTNEIGRTLRPPTTSMIPTGSSRTAIATDRIFESFLGEVHEGKTLFYGHSFAGNPLGCAVAIANLDLLPAMLAALPHKVEHLASALAPSKTKPFVGEIRQRGLMVGIELSAEPRSGIPFDRTLSPALVVARIARQRGMLIRPIGNTVIFMPPPASTNTELREMTSILVEALDEAAVELELLLRQAPTK